jgi:predicted MFS family arabinose efflux permease
VAQTLVPEVAGEQHWTARLAVLSAAAAVAVSVIYLPQSLLTDIASNLGVTPAAASIIATTVQAGYALGILLFVPLADRFHPRRQVTVQGIVLIAALIASALLPQVLSVAIGFLAVGLVANIAQIIIPAANRLSPVHRRGATTGALVGAILIGIFGGRLLSSLLVGAIGWRWVVVVFAVLVAAMLPFVRRALDAELPLDAAPKRYGRLLLSTLALAGRSRPLLQSGLMQFFVFATFNSIWTVMVLHLTAAPFNWSVLAAGLFGLVGLAAGIVVPFGGRFIDRFGPLPVAGVTLAAMILATASIIVDSTAIIPFAVTMFVATWANQTVLSANQNRALVSNPHSTAQANTLFMFVVFLGGSVGAFLGPLAYSAGGMVLVAEQGLVFTILAGILWLLSAGWSRRTARAARVTRLAPAEEMA